MNHHQPLRRGLSVLLSVLLCLSLLPMPVQAADTVKAIQLDTSGILGYDAASNSYDYIYFGNWTAPDENTTTGPIKWRVLDDKTNTGADGLFLMSEYAFGNGTYGGLCFQKDYHRDDDYNWYKGSVHQDGVAEARANAWQGSDAQAWCKDFAGIEGSGVADAFTSLELDAILETTKTDIAYSIGPQDPFESAESTNILNGDKVFFLSTEEVGTTDYGFTNENENGCDARKGKYNTNTGALRYWWLRTGRKGTTGASISGSTFRAAAAGTANVKATITDGTAIDTAFTKEFDITVTAAPSYTISANPTTLSFGSVQPGYAAPAAQTVTVTNSGNQSVTLTQPTAANYTVGALSKTTLASGETATFTIQPKAGLRESTYNETIAVQGANGMNATNAVSIAANWTAIASSGSGGAGEINFAAGLCPDPPKGFALWTPTRGKVSPWTPPYWVLFLNMLR